MESGSAVSVSGRMLSDRTVDVLLGSAVTLTMAVVITANHGGRVDPDSLAYLWAVGLGALVLVRRRYPVLVLSITVLGLFAYYAAGYPAVGVAVPIAAALFSAAEFGRMRWAVVAAVIALFTSVVFRAIEGQELSLVVGYEFAGHAVLMAGSIALGDSIRSRRQLVASARDIVVLTAERSRRRAEEQRQDERISIARDLHDSIGHSTSVVSLYADVAKEALARGDDEATTEALELIKTTTSESMLELRRTVGALRASGEPSRVAASLANVGSVTDVGESVEVTKDIRVPERLPDVVDSAAFRVIQESLTNIARHSTATHAHIKVGYGDGELWVAVTDNGDADDSGEVADSGHGIHGMRERASALGGTLEAGMGDEGFSVRASFPLEVEP